MQELTKQQLTDRFAELVEQLNQRMHCKPPDDWADLELTIPQIRALMSLRQGPGANGQYIRLSGLHPLFHHQHHGSFGG